MAFKNPGRTSEYIRSMLKSDARPNLKELEDYAQKHFIPVLLPETAVFLSQLIALKKPEKILEVGTAIGYSGQLMLYESPLSELFTIEISEDRAQLAKDFFAKSGFEKRATVFIGDAGEILPYLDGEFDFVFVDGPKTRYIEYYPYIKKRLKKGGVLLCDNILFNGYVTGEEDAGKKLSIAKKLDLFLHTLMNDGEFSTSILPVGDGLSLSIKK